MTLLQLKSYQFRRERERGWRELETLVDLVEQHGLRSLDARELGRLPTLYRSAVSSLSVARSISLDRNLLAYLEALVSRAYLCVYGTRKELPSAIAEFLSFRWPRLVRRFRWHIALAAVFLLGGLVSGWLLTLHDMDQFYALVPASWREGRTPAASTTDLRAFLFTTEQTATSLLMTFATFLFTHNAGIGILAFSLGFLAGLPVFSLLFFNGMTLGALAALYQERSLSLEFWGWILPHGITELFAVMLCGAGGLVLAQNLMFPGRHTRLHNLAVHGRQAGALVVGAVIMFFCAALIEGIFRQIITHTGIRYLVALASVVLWTSYFVSAGRRRSP